MFLVSLMTALLCAAPGAGPSPGENRANVPVTMEEGAWFLHVPPGHKGAVVLRFVERPDSVTEVATGRALSFTHDAGTLTFDPPAPLAADDSTVAVAWKNDRWDKEMEAFAEADRKQPPQTGGILFVGSSTIAIWDLDRDFPGMKALNRGFGGSQYADAVYHFRRVILPYRPATMVIYDGDNDIGSGKSPEWVNADFEALMRQIRFSLPDTRVIVLSTKPSAARWPLWDKIQQANAMNERFVQKQEKMVFLNIAPPLLDSGGKPRPELFQKDGLHLNAEGYAACSALVRPLLEVPAK